MCVTKSKDSFESTDLKTISQLSHTLLGRVDEENASALNSIIERYPELDDSLKLQLNFFHSTYGMNGELTVQKCLEVFRGMKKEVRKIFPMVERLLRLVLTSPASSCSAERSFSALRRLKTYLRSTML